MKIGKLQIIIIALAIAAGIFAILVFAGVIPGFSGSSSKNKISLTMWGSYKRACFAVCLDRSKKFQI